MANNLDIKDANLLARIIKTTDTAGVHVPHHNVDTLPVGQNTMSSSTPVVLASDHVDIPITGAVSITNNSLVVSGDVIHGDPDQGAPIKMGAQVRTTLPTAQSDADRTNVTADRFGRALTTHIDSGMQVWKQVEATTTQTGTAIWTPDSGKKVVITHIGIMTGGTTSGVVTVWFGGSADTTFSQGTDQVVFRGEFAPSTSSKPGAFPPITYPIYAATADHVLRYTTSANITVYITCYGYEI